MRRQDTEPPDVPASLSRKLSLPLLELLVKIIRSGKLLALETDTMPGLAVHALQSKALRDLYHLKKRSLDKALVWMVDDLKRVAPYMKLEASNEARAQEIMREVWPGAVTLIFSLRPDAAIHSLKLPGIKTSLALRIPDDPDLLELLRTLGEPLAVTSANYAGEKEMHTLKEVREAFGSQIHAILERCRPMSGVASTVIDLREPRPLIVRQGAVTLAFDEEE